MFRFESYIKRQFVALTDKTAYLVEYIGSGIHEASRFCFLRQEMAATVGKAHALQKRIPAVQVHEIYPQRRCLLPETRLNKFRDVTALACYYTQATNRIDGAIQQRLNCHVIRSQTVSETIHGIAGEESDFHIRISSHRRRLRREIMSPIHRDFLYAGRQKHDAA